ncbi:MAG: hypothetical protein ABSA02_31575 [Trebonia sp.]
MGTSGTDDNVTIGVGIHVNLDQRRRTARKPWPPPSSRSRFS